MTAIAPYLTFNTTFTPAAIRAAHAAAAAASSSAATAPDADANAKLLQRPRDKEVQLVYYVGVASGGSIVVDHGKQRKVLSHVVSGVLSHVPRLVSKYSLGYGRTMALFLLSNGFTFIALADEALGRARGFTLLSEVRSAFLEVVGAGTCGSISDPEEPSGVPSIRYQQRQQQRQLQLPKLRRTRSASQVNALVFEAMESRFQEIVLKCGRGKPIPRARVEVYPDAPDAYLTSKKSVHEPDLLESPNSSGGSGEGTGKKGGKKGAGGGARESLMSEIAAMLREMEGDSGDEDDILGNKIVGGKKGSEALHGGGGGGGGGRGGAHDDGWNNFRVTATEGFLPGVMKMIDSAESTDDAMAANVQRMFIRPMSGVLNPALIMEFDEDEDEEIEDEEEGEHDSGGDAQEEKLTKSRSMSSEAVVRTGISAASSESTTDGGSGVGGSANGGEGGGEDGGTGSTTPRPQRTLTENRATRHSLDVGGGRLGQSGSPLSPGAAGGAAGARMKKGGGARSMKLYSTQMSPMLRGAFNVFRSNTVVSGARPPAPSGARAGLAGVAEGAGGDPGPPRGDGEEGGDGGERPRSAAAEDRRQLAARRNLVLLRGAGAGAAGAAGGSGGSAREVGGNMRRRPLFGSLIRRGVGEGTEAGKAGKGKVGGSQRMSGLSSSDVKGGSSSSPPHPSSSD